MKGVSNVLALLLIVIAIGATAGITLTYNYLASLAVMPPITYDGQYGADASVDAADLEGAFYSDFVETTDCNVTDDVLGDSSYVGCVYETTGGVSNSNNGTDYMFAIAFEIDDGPVEYMHVNCELKNTGTLQAADDFAIENIEVFTNEDSPISYSNLAVEDGGTEVDGNTRFLPEGDYVFVTELHAKGITPDGVDGDDIMTCKNDLETSGDADIWYLTLEVGS